MKEKNSTISEDDIPSTDGEIDLSEYFRVIWSNKLIIFLFFVVSIPISIYVANRLAPIYVAEAMIEKPSDEGNKQNNILSKEGQTAALFSILGADNLSKSDNAHLAVLRSDSFLETVLVNNEAIDYDMLHKFCPPYIPPQGYSVGSLLVALGISKVRSPDEKQKLDSLIDCVNNFIAIGFYEYGKFETEAITIKVSSQDPFFSATLANQVVEKYFKWREKTREAYFRNIKEFLSDTISEAQNELSVAKQMLQSFLIEHALMGNISTTTNFQDIVTEESPFTMEMKIKIANLGQIENSQSQFKSVKSQILKFKSDRPDELSDLIASIEIQGVLSRNFVSAISKIENSSLNSETKNFETNKIIDKELVRLESQISAFERNIKTREEETLKLMNIENKFQELALDAQKKLIIFEGLKDQLNNKILETEFSKISKPTLLSKAVPPFAALYPRKKMVVALGALSFTMAGVLFVILRQISAKRVYSLSQVRKISRFLDVYKIKGDRIKTVGSKANSMPFSQMIFKNFNRSEGLGCVIDLSTRGSSDKNLATSFSNYVGHLFAKKSIGILSSKEHHSYLLSLAKSQEHVAFKSAGGSSGRGPVSNMSILEDVNEWIVSGEIEKIRRQFSQFEKIICAVDSKVDDLTKFEIMEKCDFYILVASYNKIDESVIKKFSNESAEREKKCLGFFLIN